jgi:hypothetical protein
MPSLRELQQDFAATLFAGDGAAPPFATIPEEHAVERIAVYRRALFANYRGALAATYPVVKRLVGAPFFDTAVDAFVLQHPPTSGDLNVYGDAFGAFLAAYPPAANLPYLGDVAALEWAQDEANRAADDELSSQEVLADLTVMPSADLAGAGLELAHSCRLVSSRYPVLRVWQVNQDACTGDEQVSWDSGPDRLLVRREPDGVTIERVAPGEYAWLECLASGASLSAAIEAAQNADPVFDLGSVLRTRVADRTIAGVRASSL